MAPESRIIAAELFLVLRKTNEPVSPFLWEREKAEENTTPSTGWPIGVDSGVEGRLNEHAEAGGRVRQVSIGLCKDYGLAALSRKVYIGNVKKNDLPELHQKLRRLFMGNKDRLFLFMLCKPCMGMSTVPLAIQGWIVQPPKFELVG